MKTYKHLWPELISFENLHCAAIKAQKGKRWKQSTLGFNYDLEQNLLQLQEQLRTGRYRPGRYRGFTVHEPKKRLIFAAPYRDRVVHHALINIIEPLWERRFYYHSYACRIGRGTHKALDTCQKYLRNNRYVLKCDIEKYFASIDHDILKGILAKKIRDRRVLSLIDLIIDSSPGTDAPVTYFPGDTLFTPVERKKGIPIGNLTSQFFANLYLNELDRWLKFDKRVTSYLRYMDDFMVFHDSKLYLKRLREDIREFLVFLRLNLHPKKQEVFPAKNGVPFLGFHIYTTHRRLKRENVRRFDHRMRRKQKEFADGEINLDEVRQSLMAWLGHAKHGDTWRLQQDVFQKLVFSRA